MFRKPIVYTLIIGSVLSLSCNQKKETLPSGEEKLSPDIVNNPASASGETNTKAAQFEFETTQHHFGEIKQGEKVSYVFKFTNSGGTDLVITQAQGSCGCTVPEYSKQPIKPGGSGEIKVTFNSEGRSGMQSKTVTILANSVPATKVLTISAEVLQPEKK